METDTLTLGRLVAVTPKAARVLERHDLDYCCKGDRTVTEACRAQGLDELALLREIEAEPEESASEARWDDRPLDLLIDHILVRYHEPLKEELPRLVQLARTVERVHAGKAGCPAGLAAHLEAVHAAVVSHLQKEEHILFPAIRAGQGRTAHMPVKVMMAEHEDHGLNLQRSRALAGDFVPPPEACATWTELYRSLAQLERDLMAHIHLENSVLFPRALNG